MRNTGRRLVGVAISGILLGASAFVLVGPSTAPTVVGASETGSTESQVPSSAVDSAPNTPVPPTTPSDRPIVIHGVGDMVFDPTYITDFAQLGYDIGFDGVRELFSADTVTVGNLECTPSTFGEPLDKEFVFRCPPSSLPAIRAGGVDVVNLANNHSQDHGKQAMLDGILQLELAGISPVGVGGDIDSASRPAFIEHEGTSIAVLGMGGVVPGIDWLATPDRAGMASGDDIDQMTAAVSAAAESADIVVVSIHWGVELEAEPREDDRVRAAALVAAGADVVFGHHPHRLGALEWVDGVPVFWTLGNFVWPRLSDASATTGVGRVEFRADGSVIACLLPAFIERSGRPELTGDTDCVPT